MQRTSSRSSRAPLKVYFSSEYHRWTVDCTVPGAVERRTFSSPARAKRFAHAKSVELNCTKPPADDADADADADDDHV